MVLTVWRSASLSISSRHAQKSWPSVRPRMLRWNAWLCALTKPGSSRVGATAPLSFVVVATSAVPAPLAQLPNLLTVARLAAIPAFIVLLATVDGGHSWPAGIVFGVAGVTDQLDGWLARRWGVESEFGKLADPLADRLLIDAAVILLWIEGRLPWAALAVILARDSLLLGGYKVVVPRGYDFSVNLLGKAATWVLYASIGFVL